MFAILYDDMGNVAEFDLKKAAAEFLASLEKPAGEYKTPFKDSKHIKMDRLKVDEVSLTNQNRPTLPKGSFIMFKAHDRSIKVIRKIKIEILVTLTISNDGFVKLWDGTDCLFNLKMPNLLKIHRNMGKIENLKNEKSIKKVLEILEIYKKK